MFYLQAYLVPQLAVSLWIVYIGIKTIEIGELFYKNTHTKNIKKLYNIYPKILI